MTQTTGIDKAYVPGTPVPSTGCVAFARTAPAGAALRKERAVRNTSGMATFSSSGCIQQISAVDSTDVRAQRVADLKAAIKSGSYKVPASALADKLIGGLLD